MTKQEMEQKKEELRTLLKTADTEEKVSEIEEKLRNLQKEPIEEEKPKEDGKISQEEERALLKDEPEKKLNETQLRKIGGFGMEEEKRKFTTADAEYRSAWAKTLMGQKLNEEEQRAIGDAIGTTDTTFVASSESAQGINNYGLLIPDSVKMDWMKIFNEVSPFFRDIRKLYVKGNVDLPYLFAADDAEWYTELETTKKEGQEFKNLRITGHELAKAIEITWKAAEMTVEGFISFLLEEVRMKILRALVNASIYGDGKDKPTGATNGLTQKTASNAIELIKVLLGELSNENRVGAKVYVANDVADSIAFYKDENGNYPYLIGGLGQANGTKIEADPFLKPGEILVGNASNYVINFNEDLRIDQEKHLLPRRVVYGAYLIADGMPKPKAFAYGKVTATV